MLNSLCESNFHRTGTTFRSHSTTALLTSWSGATEKVSTMWALADWNSNAADRRVWDTLGVTLTRSPARFGQGLQPRLGELDDHGLGLLVLLQQRLPLLKLLKPLLRLLLGLLLDPGQRRVDPLGEFIHVTHG